MAGVVIAARYNSLGELQFYKNDMTSPVTIDPRDDYANAAYTGVHLWGRGGQTDGLVGMGIGAGVISEAALTDIELAAIMAEFVSEFSITV